MTALLEALAHLSAIGWICLALVFAVAVLPHLAALALAAINLLRGDRNAVLYGTIGSGGLLVGAAAVALCVSIFQSAPAGQASERAPSLIPPMRSGTRPPTRRERDSDHSAWVGKRVPALAVTTLGGRKIDLAQLKGKRVLINFWATWCGPCRRELPDLEKIARETKDSELLVLALSDEDEETIREYAQKHKLALNLASAPMPPSPFDEIESIPTSVFVDKQGVIESVASGALSYQELRTRALLGDGSVSSKETGGGSGEP